MKLATLKDGSPDGTLLVVSRDLRHAAKANDIAQSLRIALEQWAAVEPMLLERSRLVDEGMAKGAFLLAPEKVAAPLPRAPQFLDGSSFLSHGRRMVRAFNLSTVSLEVSHPLMYQGASDAFLGAREAVQLPSEEHGIDIEAELGVITDAVPMGVSSQEAADHVRLLVLLDDVSLRRLLFGEMTLGFGMIQSKPTCVFSPVAVTPDELGSAWVDGRVHLALRVGINDGPLGELDAGEMGFSFFDLIAHAARTRVLSPGTIVGSGTVSNADASAGVACIAERRALEILASGATNSDWLHFGDRVYIEMFDQQRRSVFGAINHTFVPLKGTGKGNENEQYTHEISPRRDQRS